MKQLVTILAVLAALAAITGGASAAVARLITSADIKDHTIRLVDIAPATIAALRGGSGPAGIQGPAGPAGPAGGFDPNKVTYSTGAAVSVAPGKVESAYAYCPAGTKVIGGGFNASISNVAASLMRSDGTLWGVVVWNDSVITVQVNAYAVCAAP